MVSCERASQFSFPFSFKLSSASFLSDDGKEEQEEVDEKARFGLGKGPSDRHSHPKVLGRRHKAGNVDIPFLEDADDLIIGGGVDLDAGFLQL